MTDDIPHDLSDAFGVEWESPPPDASRKARQRPPGDPVPEPSDAAPVESLRPDDVRGVSAPTGGTISRSLPGLDVTLAVTPPTGDELWVIDGRAWRNPPSEGEIRVALVHDTHVIASTTIRDGAHFRLEELLPSGWTIEFHLDDGSVVALQAPADSP